MAPALRPAVTEQQLPEPAAACDNGSCSSSSATGQDSASAAFAAPKQVLKEHAAPRDARRPNRRPNPGRRARTVVHACPAQRLDDHRYQGPRGHRQVRADGCANLAAPIQTTAPCLETEIKSLFFNCSCLTSTPAMSCCVRLQPRQPDGRVRNLYARWHVQRHRALRGLDRHVRGM